MATMGGYDSPQDDEQFSMKRYEVPILTSAFHITGFYLNKSSVSAVVCFIICRPNGGRVFCCMHH